MKDIHLHLQSHTVTHEWFQSAIHGGLKHLLHMFEIHIIGDMVDGSRPAAVFLRHVHVYFQATHSMPIGINFSQHAVWHPFFTACRLASTFHSRPIGYFSDILSLSAPCRHHMRSSICFPFSTHPSRFGSHDPGPPPCRRKHG